MEDEDDDEVRDFDDSQSCAKVTPISIPGHFDSTGTKHGETGSEAAISVDTTPAASMAGVEESPTWPNESQVAQSTQGSPSGRTHHPRTANPVEVIRRFSWIA